MDVNIQKDDEDKGHDWGHDWGITTFTRDARNASHKDSQRPTRRLPPPRSYILRMAEEYQQRPMASRIRQAGSRISTYIERPARKQEEDCHKQGHKQGGPHQRSYRKVQPEDSRRSANSYHEKWRQGLIKRVQDSQVGSKFSTNFLTSNQWNGDTA